MGTKSSKSNTVHQNRASYFIHPKSKADRTPNNCSTSYFKISFCNITLHTTIILWNSDISFLFIVLHADNFLPSTSHIVFITSRWPIGSKHEGKYTEFLTTIKSFLKTEGLLERNSHNHKLNTMQNFQMFNQVVNKVNVRLKRLILHQFSLFGYSCSLHH